MENFKQVISLIFRMGLENKISNSCLFPSGFGWFLGWGLRGLGGGLTVVEIMYTTSSSPHASPVLQKMGIHMSPKLWNLTHMN